MLKLSLNNTPKKLGYFMPAEWESHDAIWLSWPHDPITFPHRVEKVEKTYGEIIKALQPGEKVNLLVKDSAMKQRAQDILKQSGANPDEIAFHIYDYADVWFRDYGPLFLVNKTSGSLAMSHWIFNAWGGKYETLMPDTHIPEFINRSMNIPCFTPGIVLEGGSIDVNGKGTLLTTEQCLLNKNRNPHLNKSGIEEYLREYLGVTHIIWLKNGIEGDDTDGHIDDIARFVNPSTVLCAYEKNRNDVNYSALHENYEILCHAKDQSGNR
ncbi:MAG: agmatine deiminase family protein, partial [Deltaproteobacteria bacterium]|nr:agmatine deiminase family protein [Deltaproteobacteria bacterium]